MSLSIFNRAAESSSYSYVQAAALLKSKDIQYVIFKHLDVLHTLLVFWYIFLL